MTRLPVLSPHRIHYPKTIWSGALAVLSPCIYSPLYHDRDRLCGLVVRVSGYRYRGPGFDPRRIVVVGLERGPLSLVRSN